MKHLSTTLAFTLLFTCSLVQGAFGAEEVAKTTAGKVMDSSEKAVPIPVGTKLPDVEVATLSEKTVKLSQVTGGKPTAIIFYRGGWCPYCNQHLSSLREIEAPLKELGVSLLALSPDLPKYLAETVKGQELSYTLVSDAKAEAMKAFGIAFRLDDGTFTKYKESYNIDIEKNSGETHHVLPVPSVFLVDAAGTIQFVYSDADYKSRLDNEKLLAAAKKVAGE